MLTKERMGPGSHKVYSASNCWYVNKVKGNWWMIRDGARYLVGKHKTLKEAIAYIEKYLA